MKWCLCLLLAIFRPSKLQEIYKTVEAVAGQTAELPCNVTSEKPGDKLNILAWYKNGSKTAIYSRDLRGQVEQESIDETLESGMRTMEMVEASEDFVQLVMHGVRIIDSGLYYCLADFAASPAHKTYVDLVVIEPPERMWVVHENGTRVVLASVGAMSARVSHDIGPYYIGDTIHLFCVAFGGKPQPRLSWWIEGSKLKEALTPLSERRVRTEFTYGPLKRSDNARILTCRATNNNISAPLIVDVHINMHLPPEIVSVHAPKGVVVQADEPLTLQCIVVDARPTPTVIWRLEENQLFNLEQNVTESANHILTSAVQLTALREHDGSRISCCVPAERSRQETYVCADPIVINVTYAPGLVLTAIENVIENGTLRVVKGTEVALQCNIKANPLISDFAWYHGDDLLTINNMQDAATGLTFLNLSEASETDAGEYVCAAANTEGATTSDPLIIQITYPPTCTEESIEEYGVVENEAINITCKVKGSPEPTSYKWILVNGVANMTAFIAQNNTACTVTHTASNTFEYTRTNETTYGTVFCWGLNGVSDDKLPHTPCTFLITDETAPRPPFDCLASKNPQNDITVLCQEGHNGGLPQKFNLTVKSLRTDSIMMSIINLSPEFIIKEPEEEYQLNIISSNAKGDSKIITINVDDVVEEKEGINQSTNTVTDLTTLTLSLCGGVALIALVACGLVLCAHDNDRTPRNSRVRAHREPTIYAFTDESNCDENESDESECNARRTDSMRNPSKSNKRCDVKRTSSFHSHFNETENEGTPKCNRDVVRHVCRVHSMQNIRRKDMDAMCDHLVMHLPSDMPNYSVPRPATFYTMPRKVRGKIAKTEEASDLGQSDGLSLPPPPDEFTPYRAGQSVTTPINDTRMQYSNVIISPMNTVGLPTVSGIHDGYTFADDTKNGVNTLTTFQSTYSGPRESGL